MRTPPRRSCVRGSTILCTGVLVLLAGCRLEVSVEQVGQRGFARDDELRPPGRFVGTARIERLLLPSAPTPRWSPGEWARAQVETKASAVLRVIHARDGRALGALVHPTCGVRFSPFASHQTTDDLRFAARDVVALLDEAGTKRVYPWGADPDTHATVRLTVSDYLARYVDDHDWEHAPRKEYRELDPTDDRYALYPQGIAVRYDLPRDVEGTVRGLELIFMRAQSTWWLVAIAHA